MPPGMTMTDVDIGCPGRSRSPGTKAAVAYLAASGATAISLIEVDGVCTISIWLKIDPHALSVQWVSARPLLVGAKRSSSLATPKLSAAVAIARKLRSNLTPWRAGASKPLAANH